MDKCEECNLNIGGYCDLCGAMPCSEAAMICDND